MAWNNKFIRIFLGGCAKKLFLGTPSFLIKKCNPLFKRGGGNSRTPESGVASVSATIAFPASRTLNSATMKKYLLHKTRSLDLLCRQRHWRYAPKKFHSGSFLTFQPPFAADPKKLRKLTLQEWGINKFNHWHNIEVGITKIHSILCNLL